MDWFPAAGHAGAGSIVNWVPGKREADGRRASPPSTPEELTDGRAPMTPSPDNSEADARIGRRRFLKGVVAGAGGAAGAAGRSGSSSAAERTPPSSRPTLPAVPRDSTRRPPEPVSAVALESG